MSRVVHSQLSDNLKTRCRWLGTLVRPTEKARAEVGRPDGWEVVLLDLGRCCCSGWRQSVDLSNIVSISVCIDLSRFYPGISACTLDFMLGLLDGRLNTSRTGIVQKI